jgi:uncharacterized protein (TIGR02145 family)
MKNITTAKIHLLVISVLFAFLATSCKKANDETTVTDIDGNVYNIITIETQVWMVENLRTIKFSNGDLIGTTDPPDKSINGEITPEYQWAYNGDEDNVDTYGRLYTWYAAIDNRNICPTGWHVPSDDEWTTLADNLGGLDIAGGKLKEPGTTHWKTPNAEASNLSGFMALPGGYRGFNGLYYDMSEWGNWWSSTASDETQAWLRWLYYDDGTLGRGLYGKENGMSVRCLKD